MKTAYSYIRWSTKSQGETGRDSRERQTTSADKWITEHSKGEYVLSKEAFVDDGKSATKGKHIEKDANGRAKGELQRFIQLVEEGKIKKDSILLIDSYDRFSRLPTAASLALFSQVISSGIGLVFTSSHEKRVINNALLTKEPHILYFIIGEMIRSFTESAEKSRKIISAKQAKKEKMQRGEIVPHNNVPKYFSFVNGKYDHNNNTEIVRRLIKGIIAGKTLYSLADTLNAESVKTFRRGYQWSGNSIRAILRNRVLVGEYLGNKNYLKPIISEEVFQKVQNILNNNSFNHGATGHFANIFRGICFCADCGKTMQVATQTVKHGANSETHYRYLRCSIIGKHSACKNRKHIKLDAMEKAFFCHFLDKHPYEMINADERKEVKDLERLIAANEGRLHKLNSDMETAVNLIGSIPANELKSKLVKLEKERDKVKTELDSLTAKVGMIKDAPVNFRTVIGKTIDLYEEKDGENLSTPIYDYPMDKLIESLKDNTVREKTRVLLPSLIGKITVDTNAGRFYVFNRMGKMIFKSLQIISSRNRSEIWKKSLKGAKKVNRKSGK